MAGKNWVDKLLELQEIDIKLQQISEQIQKIPLTQKELENQLNQYKEEGEKTNNSKREIDAQIKQIEHEVEKKEQHIKSLKTKMILIKDNVSYRKMLLEIEQTNNSISDLENQQLILMEEADQKQAEVEKATAKLNDQQKLVDQQSHKLSDQLKKLENQQIQQQACYTKQQALIDEDIYNRYKRIRQSLGGRKGKVVVNIDEDKCGACFIKLPAQLVINATKRKENTTCNNCGVLIYN